MDKTDVIIKPLITEKSTHQQTTRNAYAFQVRQSANKPQIRHAVEKLYDVKVDRSAHDEPQGQAAPDQDQDGHDQRLEARGGCAGGEFEDRVVLKSGVQLEQFATTNDQRRGTTWRSSFTIRLPPADERAASSTTRPSSPSSTPEPSLTVGTHRANGRNHHGVITAKHRGGGNKKLYRIIDFKRRKDDMPAKVTAIEYDPNRSVFIALIEYEDGEKSYILAPNGLKVGATVVNGPNSPPDLGNCIPLANIPTGLEIHNIEMNPGQGGKLVRSAGGVGRLGSREGRVGGRHSPIRRNAARSQRLPRDDRPAWKSRLDQRQHRQGRPVTAHGHSPAHPCQGDEPHRPSAGWW